MNKNVLIATTEILDGSMSKGVDVRVRDSNRRTFLAKHNVAPEQATLVHITYDSDDYLRYKTVSLPHKGDGIAREPSFQADALFTEDSQLALFLPIADCIGMVLHDPDRRVLGLSHLGRHNLVQLGGTATVQYMRQEFGSDITKVQVWLSVAAGKGAYPLHDFDGRSLHEVALEQVLHAGILQENVSIDDRDTTNDHALFSHSEYLKGNRESDGRQAVVAMMR